MIIKNTENLATSELRKHALEIIEAGIARVLPDVIMRSSVSYDSNSRTLTVNGISYDVPRGRIFVIGGGKASGRMAAAIEEIIGDDIAAGIVSCKSGGDRFETRKIKVISAGHPVPDWMGVSAVNEMLFLKQAYSIDENDLVICLISGGGSALMPSPAEGISLEDKQKLTGLLLSSGADIYEINTVRKHISLIKGGKLGRLFAPTQVVSLILSDVIGSDLSVIASGLTYPDSSTFFDAWDVLEKYGLPGKIPEPIEDYLKRGTKGFEEETPERLDNCHNHIIGDNILALEAMAAKATELGYAPNFITTKQQGEPAAAAELRAGEIIQGKYKDYTALLIGGETTPKLPESPGKGGRNQHFAVVSMLEMEKYRGEWVVASVGTDGSDFIPEAAGAIVDPASLNAAKDKKLNVKSYLDKYDSYTLLEKIGNSLIETGDTGTNVGDVCLYLLSER